MLHSGLNAQNGSGGDADSIKVWYTSAKDFAYNDQHEKGKKLCLKILEKDSSFADVSVLLGRIYAWDKQYDSAKLVLSHVLANSPTHYDAIDAMIDIALWTDRYEDAIRYADIGLARHKNDADFLLKKARALNYLDRSEDAVTILQQILQLDQTNKKAQTLLNSIKVRKHINKISADYAVDAFQKKNPWQFLYLQYTRPTKYFGSVTARVNYAYRYQQEGLQLEVDAYPNLKKGTYLYLNGGYAKNNVFPYTRFGLELYQKLPKSFEASVGFRYMNFEQKSLIELDSTKVLIYTATLGKYIGNYWISGRTFITPGDKGFSKSFIFILRRYLEDADNYLSLSVGTGFSPDEHRYAFIDPTLYYLKSQKVYFTYQKRFLRRFISNVGVGVAHEEYYPKTFQLKYSANVGLSYFF